MSMGFELVKIFVCYPLEALFKLDDAKIEFERKVFHRKHPLDRAYDELIEAYQKFDEDDFDEEDFEDEDLEELLVVFFFVLEELPLLFTNVKWAFPSAYASPRLLILLFFSNASVCLWLKIIAPLGRSTNSAPLSPTV